MRSNVLAAQLRLFDKEHMVTEGIAVHQDARAAEPKLGVAGFDRRFVTGAYDKTQFRLSKFAVNFSPHTAGEVIPDTIRLVDHPFPPMRSGTPLLQVGAERL
jgi:hypothetical protein